VYEAYKYVSLHLFFIVSLSSVFTVTVPSVKVSDNEYQKRENYVVLLEKLDGRIVLKAFLSK